jgi:hypothetical protein
MTHVEAVEVKELSEFFGVGEVLVFLLDDLHEVLYFAFQFIQNSLESHWIFSVPKYGIF